MLCASIIGQDAAIEALKNGKHDMESMKNEYFIRRNLIVKRFTDLGLPCVMPEGAFYIYPNISSTGMDSEHFARKLLETQHVAVVPGTAFGSNGRDYIRCSYATGINDIEIVMDRIADFISKSFIPVAYEQRI